MKSEVIDIKRCMQGLNRFKDRMKEIQGVLQAELEDGMVDFDVEAFGRRERETEESVAAEKARSADANGSKVEDSRVGSLFSLSYQDGQLWLITRHH